MVVLFTTVSNLCSLFLGSGNVMAAQASDLTFTREYKNRYWLYLCDFITVVGKVNLLLAPMSLRRKF